MGQGLLNMKEKTEPFKYRESVRAYLERPDVRHAVNLLLDRKIGFMPKAFTTEEISDFYTACMAARQTQIDFVQDMVDMWHRVWGREPLGDDWTPVPNDPAIEDLTLDPTVRWSTNHFERRFEYNKRLRVDLWLYLGSNDANPNDVELGCDLWRDGRQCLKASECPVLWRWDKAARRIRYENDGPQYSDGLKLDKLKAAAQQAVRLIKRFGNE